MSDPKEIKLYVCMNEDGDYEVDADQDAAMELLSDNYGGSMRRMVCITTTMSPPEVIEVEAAAVPDEVGTTGPIEAA